MASVACQLPMHEVTAGFRTRGECETKTQEQQSDSRILVPFLLQHDDFLFVRRFIFQEHTQIFAKGKRRFQSFVEYYVTHLKFQGSENW